MTVIVSGMNHTTTIIVENILTLGRMQRSIVTAISVEYHFLFWYGVQSFHRADEEIVATFGM